MAIVDIEPIEGLKLLYKPDSTDPKALLLVSADGKGITNIMSFGSWFVSPLEPRGWCFSVHIFPKHYTHDLIEKTGEFTVNVPGDGMDDVVKYCGSVSGRDHDKFKDLSLTKVSSRYVSAPIIGECAVHLECETLNSRPFTMTFPGQDREDLPMTIFASRILAFRAQEGVVQRE